MTKIDDSYLSVYKEARDRAAELLASRGSINTYIVDGTLARDVRNARAMVSTLEVKARENIEEQYAAAKRSYYGGLTFPFNYTDPTSSKPPMVVRPALPIAAQDIQAIRDWYIKNRALHGALLDATNAWLNWNVEVENYFSKSLIKSHKNIVKVPFKSRKDEHNSESTGFPYLVNFFTYIRDTPLYGSDGKKAEFCKTAESAKNREAKKTITVIRDIVHTAQRNKTNAESTVSAIRNKREAYLDLIDNADAALSRINQIVNSGSITLYPPSIEYPNGYYIDSALAVFDRGFSNARHPN